MIIVFIDGSGNGYYGYQMYDEEPTIYHASGKITFNQAEFEALVCLLKDLKPKSHILVFSDSKIVVNSYKQSWCLKNARLKQLRDQALHLAKKKEISIRIEWIPREQNLFGIYLDEYRTMDMNRTI